MNTAIKTTFLSDQDLSQVQSILDQHGLSGFDASVRLWGRGKAIEVKGTLGRQELCCLLAIARFLGEDGASCAANEVNSNSVAVSPADPIIAMPLDRANVAPAGQVAAG